MRRRALIVEDEIFVALHLETVLQSLGLEVCDIVATGLDAVQALGSAPDIIFMDINIRGDIDGVETARRIREAVAVPIVFVTAYSDAATLQRIDRVIPGALVLHKPTRVNLLEDAIRKAMKGR